MHQSRSVDIDGVRLHVVDEGSGPELVLLHGFPLDHTMWQAQIDFWSASHRVLAPDLRGFGRSGPAMELLTMQQHAVDLRQMLEALEIDRPVRLCGLSMGGYVMWEFWQRFGSRVDAMILCDTREAADDEAGARGREQMALGVLESGAGWVADSMIPKLVSAATMDRDGATVARLREMIESTSPGTIVAAQRGLARRADHTSTLHTITVPSLLICGEHDAISTVDNMRQMAGRIPDARFEIIPGAGHMSPMEEPDQVNALVADFLQGI